MGILLLNTWDIHTVSTSLIDSEASGNAVVVLKNNGSGNQREVLLVDPSLLSQTDEQDSSGNPSDNTGLTDTSPTFRQILGNKIGPEFRQWLNDNPGLDPLDHLKKARVHLANETIHLSDPGSPLKLRRFMLGKEAFETLPWLTKDPRPNRLACLKIFKKQLPDSKSLKIDSNQVLENEIFEPCLHIKSGSLLVNPFTPINQPVSKNATTHLPNCGSTKRPRRVEIKKISLDPLRWLSNHSGPSNFLNSLKRSRRQADNETGEAELPRWPGVPQNNLRTSKMTTSHVKRKILLLMLQSLYSAQERLWPLGPIVAKYDHLTPYRMAFIFMKLDQLVHEGHSIYMYLRRQSNNPAMTMTRRLQLYSQLMRRNVDVTYLVDYIMERVPRDQVVRIRQWVIRHEQAELMKKKVNWDKTMATRYIGRPDF